MSVSTLWQDERAIEGLPIRLVIALVVGVACLGVMMSVVGGLGSLNSTELDTQPDPEIVEPGTNNVTVTVVDPDGEPIEDATVVATGDTANLSSVQQGTTGSDGETTLEIDASLRPNQDEGRIELDIRPPDGDYVDDRENTGVLVIDG
jgi:hypothetical protein